MRTIFLVPTLALCACQIEIGRGELDPLTYHGIAKSGPDVQIVRDVELVSAAHAQDFLDRYGPDKIGAITGVDLTLDDARVEGMPDGIFGEPAVTVQHIAFTGIGDTQALDAGDVDMLRARLLTGSAVVAPMTVAVHAEDAAQLAKAPPSLQILVVIQPTLHIDATKSF